MEPVTSFPVNLCAFKMTVHMWSPSFSSRIYNGRNLMFVHSIQSSDSFEEFADNVQLSLDKISNQNPFLTALLCDINAKSSNWYKYNKTA